MLRLQTPPHAGSREHARDLIASLPQSLSGQVVVLDCGPLLVATPSFFDEIVKLVLEAGRATRLEILKASQRARELIERAALNRGVSDRVKVAVAAL